MFKYIYELVKSDILWNTCLTHQLMGCTCTHRYNLSMNDKIITIQLTRSWGNKNILYVKHVRKPLSLRRQTWYSSVSLISRSPLLILNYTLKGLGASIYFVDLQILFSSQYLLTLCLSVQIVGNLHQSHTRIHTIDKYEIS